MGKVVMAAIGMSLSCSSTIILYPSTKLTSASASSSSSLHLSRCCLHHYRCTTHHLFSSSAPSAAATTFRFPLQWSRICSSSLFLSFNSSVSSLLLRSVTFEALLALHHKQFSGNNNTSSLMRGLCVGLVRTMAKGNDRDCLVLARRQAAIALCLGLFSLPFAHAANAEGANSTGSSGPFSKYLKRRKLYPLETYILPILLCRLQFKEVEGKLLAETPLYADARSLLRSGPLGSLRTDIRAVAEYASEAGNGKVASDAVEQCLRALEDLDSLMLRASRDDTSVTIDNMRTRLGMAITALNNLLGTVPAPILDKGEAMILEYTIAAEASPVDSN